MSSDRSEVLEAGSVAVSDAWVERVRRDLLVDHRRIVGGWPGTLREARARTYAHFASPAGERCYGALTADELEFAARAVYMRARRRWLTRVEE